jgi:chromosome partitioning protein
MSLVISIAQCKGGVGKTTLAVCLAAELKERGGDVVLIDSDPHRSSGHWAEPGNLGFPVREIIFDDQSVTTWAGALQRVTSDYVVIDTAPNDRALGAVIALSDLVIAPCTPSGLDLVAIARTLEIVDAVRRRSQHAPSLILVPNRVDLRTLEGQQLLEELNSFGEDVAPPIGYRTAFVRAFATGHSISAQAPESKAHQEIRGLCRFVKSKLAERQMTTAQTQRWR